MPLWKFSKEQREAMAREIEPDTREVHSLTTGLWIAVTLENGEYRTIGADRVFNLLQRKARQKTG